jgi:hypothetical protein
MRERLLPVLTIGLVVALAPAALIAAVGRHPVQLDSRAHFYAVGVTALAAAAAAVALTIVGARFNDTRTVLVGTAFAAMAALLALHGLATPGFFFGYTGVLPLPRGPRGVRPLLVLEGLLLTLILGLGLSALFVPSLVPAVPAANTNEA